MTNTESKPKLEDIIRGAQLPALPQSAIRLLELSQDPENGPTEFAVPIEADPGLTGQVLRFVNSSYFGFSREISSIKLAITLVGVRTIKNFALWSAVFSLMPNPKCGPFDLKSLWKDSLRRGLFARSMGNVMGIKEAEDLFAAALLQDMAVPLLAKEMPDEYMRLFAGRHDGHERLSKLEQEVFGWTHADAAAAMARSWSLPDEFANLIKEHSHFEEMLENPDTEPGQLAVALSSMLPSNHDPSWNERDQFEKAYEKLKGDDGPDILKLLQDVDEQFTEFAPVLKLAASGKTLVESYQEEAVAKV